VNTLPVEVPLNPAFSVRTEVPTFVVVSGGAGRSPLLRVFDYNAGVERLRFYAYEQSYEGGVRVATGDVDGDGIPDIVAATGRGVDPAFEFSAERTAPFFGNFSLMNQPFEAGFSLQWPM